MPACSDLEPRPCRRSLPIRLRHLLSPDSQIRNFRDINSLLLIHSWLARAAVISGAFTKSGALVAGSCVKYPNISDKMVTDIAASGAEAVLAEDLGCLLNMAGEPHRQVRQVEIRHVVAEVLARMADRVPAIGAPR